MNENDKLELHNFLNNLYEESYTIQKIINPMTNETEIVKIQDFENKMIKSFYIDNGFKDMRFINPQKNMIDEVDNWIETKDSTKNIYLSVNTFKIISKEDYECNKKQATTKKEKERKYTPFRRTGDTVYYSNAIFIDLDFYHIDEYKNHTPIQMYNLIKKEQSRFLKALGNYCFVCSGKGLYLFVKFDKTLYFLNDKYKELWRNISVGINYRLQKYGADFKCKGDFARIFRCPYTFNNKNGDMKQAYIIEPFKREGSKTARELLKLVKRDLSNVNTVLSPTKTKTQKTITKKDNKAETETIYNESLIIKNNENDLWHITDPYYIKWFVDERLWDLDILLILRDFDLKGCRNYFFFVYATILNCKTKNTEDTYNILIDVNSKLKEKLNETEIIHIVNNIANKNYKFTNFKIKELLNITDDESKKLGLSYTNDELREQHKIIRNESYTKLHGKMEKKKEKIIKIIKENPFANVKDLMRLTGLSRRQVYRYLKKVA